MKEIDRRIIHDINLTLAKSNLQRLYGKVAESENQVLLKFVSGEKILDIGAGLGTLLQKLKSLGLDAIGIDIDTRSIEFAKEFYNLHILNMSIYKTSFKSNEFDTIILREVSSHLEFDKALKEISILCKKEIIIFESNPYNLLIKLSRNIIGHKEFNELNIGYYKKQLGEKGYNRQKLYYFGVFLIPISGGLLSIQLVPNIKVLYSIILFFDSILSFIIRTSGLGKLFCWHYILYCSKQT